MMSFSVASTTVVVTAKPSINQSASIVRSFLVFYIKMHPPINWRVHKNLLN